MVAISRVQAVFTGGAVIGPSSASAYTTGPVENLRGAWGTFWTGMAGAQPNSLTVTIPNSGETYDDATGNLIEIWTNGTAITSAGTVDTGFPRGVGARVIWQTAGLTNSRRVRGTTYLVPLAGGSYASDGTLTPGAVTAFSDLASAFVAATQSDFVIWTRPVEGAGGKTQGVTGHFVPDKISTLRSRRV